jgi:hypothetical protein
MKRIFALVKKNLTNKYLPLDKMVEVLISNEEPNIDTFINLGPNAKVLVKVKEGEYYIPKKYLYSYWFI